MIVDSGKIQFNMIAAQNAPVENYQFCLYTNTPTWAHDTVIGDLVEAAWTSYARQGVVPGSWGTPVLNASFQAVSIAGSFATFANGSGVPQTANGFFVVGLSSGILYGGAEFTSPLVIAAGTGATFAPTLVTDTI